MAALTAAGIAAALGSAGAQVYSANQAGSGNPNVKTIPAPPYAGALQRYMARLLAANATQSAPSVLDFARSGGTAKFNIQDTGFGPQEAQNLGFTDQNGRPVPYFDAKTQNALTPEQALFIGQNRITSRARGKDVGPETLQEKYARLLLTDQKLKARLQAGDLPGKQQKKAQAAYMKNAGQLYTAQSQLFGDEPYLPTEAGGGPKKNPGDTVKNFLDGKELVGSSFGLYGTK